jgi:hypothetical protein
MVGEVLLKRGWERRARALFLIGDAGERFTRLKLQSGSNSFGVDNLYMNAPIPEPAT